MMRIGARFYRKTILSGVACATLLLITGFIISNAQQGGTITGRVINDEAQRWCETRKVIPFEMRPKESRE